MERSKGRHYTAVCLAGDHMDAYIHTKKPPEISPVYRTEIYPKKHEIETLKDRDMKTVPAVDQMTRKQIKWHVDELNEYIDNKLGNYREIARRNSDLANYCAICSEHRPGAFGLNMQTTVVCHDHNSTRVRRIVSDTDVFRQYNWSKPRDT